MYYSIADLAKEFSISPYTVKRWIKLKKIKAVKIGKLWRIPKEEVNRLKAGESSEG